MTTTEAIERDVQLLDPYLRYKHVFLFDPVAKRKYPLLTDGDGDFQAQPIQVKGEPLDFEIEHLESILTSLACRHHRKEVSA